MSDNSNSKTLSQTNQLIRQIINAWTAQNALVTKFMSKYDEQEYLRDVVPGRSRSIYLFGHLLAVNDALLPLFGLGERLFPEYEAIFLTSPDKSVDTLPSLNQLRENWKQVNEILTDHFTKMTADDWFSRHTRVSPEDFALDPQRNKLNVLLSRTVHLGYHLGQLNFINAKQKEEVNK